MNTSDEQTYWKNESNRNIEATTQKADDYTAKEASAGMSRSKNSTALGDTVTAMLPMETHPAKMPKYTCIAVEALASQQALEL
ncbi:MAG: hypothetical protein GX663_05205 [Clostridiales bacterium]|nr:hypothetical protein [Clostridiales bacterium]